MADNSGLIKVGLVAGAAYLAYRQGWLSFLGIGAASQTPATTPTAPVVNPNAITGANSLDAIYTRLVKAAAAPSDGLNVDQWNYFLNAQLTPLGKSAPDPMTVFSAAVPNFDRSQLMSGAQYWNVMAPALKTQLGLSGLGLYAGLGAVMMRSRYVH